MASDVEVGHGFVCDDVRREESGKLIIIGVYSTNIIVHELPAALNLSLVTPLRSQADIDAPIAFRVTMNGENLRHGTGHVKLPRGSNWVIIPNILLNPKTEGVLAFDIQLDNQAWKNVCLLPLALAEPSGATATQQSS